MRAIIQIKGIHVRAYPVSLENHTLHTALDHQYHFVPQTCSSLQFAQHEDEGASPAASSVLVGSLVGKTIYYSYRPQKLSAP